MIKGCLTVVCLLIIAAGVTGLYYVERHLAMARASRSWPTVTGTITTSEVDERRFRAQQDSRDYVLYVVRIRYDYTVKGQTYSSDRIRLSLLSGRYLGKSEAYGLINRYPLDRQVTVYHKPGEPEFAVLEPGAFPSKLVRAARRASIVALAIGTVLLLSVLLGRRLMRYQ